MAENVKMGKAALNPAALTVVELASLLRHAGAAALTEDMVRQDVASGAPTNPDGTVNLVHFTAWLVREAAGGKGRGEAGGD